MGKFKVLLNGKNFLLNVDGREQRLGFYTTRFVEAATADEAESAAVELLRTDEILTANIRNEQTDSPMLYVEEITEVSRLKEGANVNAGFSFYAESKE